jgi:molybdopterin/thiamine biosynthesis adenylyltransferase
LNQLVLIDFDRLDVGNLSRHVCDVTDVGRLKTLAVRDKVLAINPYLKVECHEIDVVAQPDMLERAVQGCHLIVAGTDNNASRYCINDVSLGLCIPAIYGRVVVRAAGGDVVRVRPGTGGPCLACIFTKAFLASKQEEVSSLKQAEAVRPAYSDSAEVPVQVGLSSDIAPITNMMVKLALLELSRNAIGAGLCSLESDLQAAYYTWGNRREANYEAFKPMAQAQLSDFTILRWYAFSIRRQPCFACGYGIEH